MIIIITVLLLLTAIIADITVTISSRKSCFSNISDLHPASAGLILGTSSRLMGGRTNLYYQYRMEAGTEVFFSGKVKTLIVSGHADNPESGSSYDESAEMRRDLIARGIPEDKIVMDAAGSRTINSIRNTRDSGVDSVIIISQKFHNQRAIYISEKLGLKASAYNARDVSRKAGAKTRMREVFARLRMFLDLLRS